MEKIYSSTPLGIVQIEGNHDGITRIILIDEKKEADIQIFDPEKETQSPVLKEVVVQLQEYFDKKRTHFTFKLNPKGTDFQKKVWKGLETIPFGKTLSYLRFSEIIGDVKAIRAVANANSKNPLWIVVPCHRVIGSDGSLTGYAGGLWRKKWLLEHEIGIQQETLF